MYKSDETCGKTTLKARKRCCQKLKGKIQRFSSVLNQDHCVATPGSPLQPRGKACRWSPSIRFLRRSQTRPSVLTPLSFLPTCFRTRSKSSLIRGRGSQSAYLMHKSDPLGCLTFPSLKRPAARCYFPDGWFRSSLSSCIKNCPDSTHHRLAQFFPSMKIPFHTGNACSKNCSPDCLASGHTEGEFLGVEGWLGSGKLSTPESSRYPHPHVPFCLLLGAN